TEKKLLRRDETTMKHVYTAAVEEQKTKGMLLDKFVNTLYNGSRANLMMQLLGNKKNSKKEIEEIKKLLDKLDNK
ncbi:MAG TPA: BlaI/MecI/CopY family transcriptional regulator, partial [Flavobacteriales bacterium]|nr:BlaI/MecI/CopY family transcriptional regulator [Flavobacteriales bacterium]